ncbi:histidine phosphatase family protein [Algibacter miyuki]|uniref:Histidine phosphatase family protein n=1 Tax=Algibacter miyuki TaxID=1306933 RepID=A0ABV5GVY2_9FLAO|nr:phosphoglycerate mutase family protein [Algibacter miyuki]MDN3665121.1 phosphoglycerate mutase family protein [Algibacter miyuki]
MSFKNYIIIVFAILGLQHVVNAQENDELFTIYLVRHAEKELSPDNRKNPSLSPCGVQRAESLSDFLEDVPLDAIYSTDYTRTKSTAQPTSIAKQIEVNIYNPSKLKDFAKSLLESNEDALVVGHSNTTAALAGLLIGEKLETINEKTYNRVYQVVIHKDSGRLHILRTAFTCNH